MTRLALATLLTVVACGPAAVSPTALPEPSITRTVPPTEAVTATAAPATAAATRTNPPAAQITLKEFPVPAGSAPHDVAPAADGGVWYTAQRTGELGHLDPRTGQTKHVKLGPGSSPHGVIVGPDGAPWITDSGLNAIVRVDPRTSEVTRFTVPGRSVNLNTAVFDQGGTLWFTGQSGAVGRLKRDEFGLYRQPPGVEDVISVPPGPYGITAVRAAGRGAMLDDVFYASLAGDHIARLFSGPPVESRGGTSVFFAQPIAPPTKGAGPRRVWTDSKGVIWVSEWNAGQLGRYDPASQQWKEWKLPGSRPQAYAVFVDDRDIVWLSDFGASAIVRFDPATEKFDVYPHAPGGNVRQIHGRPGEVWGALSAHDKLLLVTTR